MKKKEKSLVCIDRVQTNPYNWRWITDKTCTRLSQDTPSPSGPSHTMPYISLTNETGILQQYWQNFSPMLSINTKNSRTHVKDATGKMLSGVTEDGKRVGTLCRGDTFTFIQPDYFQCTWEQMTGSSSSSSIASWSRSEFPGISKCFVTKHPFRAQAIISTKH